jgi:hypothetical protein
MSTASAARSVPPNQPIVKARARTLLDFHCIGSTSKGNVAQSNAFFGRACWLTTEATAVASVLAEPARLTPRP